MGPCLRSYLKEANSNFFLQRLNIQRKGYLKYVMEECTTGIYICFLKSHDNVTEHCIGINVDKREIYDCEEEGVLDLSIKNINRCCGGSKEIKNFHLCVMLKNRRM